MGSKPTGRLLTATEYKALLDHMRLWPPGYRDKVASLVRHAQALKDALQKARDELQELRQAELFRKGTEAEELAKRTAMAPPPPPREPKVCYPLPVRLREMVAAGQRGSDEWARTLRWNSLTEAHADRLLQEFEGLEGTLKTSNSED